MSIGILQAVAYLTREVLYTSTSRELSGVAVTPVLAMTYGADKQFSAMWMIGRMQDGASSVRRL